tara:strand:+ start:376 stop:573 length:198 start_codon:yes stop_codon:yes gene_type:complete
MKTGLEWAKLYGCVILDPDGFGERKAGVPRTTDLMDEATFKKAVGRSSCKFLDMGLFMTKYHGGK